MINVDVARGVAKRNQLQDDPITLDQPNPRGARITNFKAVHRQLLFQYLVSQRPAWIPP